jgi:plastocyanin
MSKAIALSLALAMLGAAVLAAGPAAAGGKRAKVTVGNNFFSPTSKTIKRGTKVRFKWTGGGAPHNVTKRKGPGGRFASKTTGKRGVNYVRTFKKKGTYKLFCTIHPESMKLKLRVR